MNFNLCPSCLAENAEDALRCQACGRPLDEATVPVPLDQPPTQLLPGGLWLDDLADPPSTVPAAFQSTLPSDFKLTLRDVQEEPSAAPVPRPAASRRLRPVGRMLASPPLPSLPALAAEAPAPAPAARPADPPAPPPAMRLPPLIPLPTVLPVPELDDAVPYPPLADMPPPRDIPTLTDAAVEPAPPLPRPLPRAEAPPPAQARAPRAEPASPEEQALQAKRAARRASVRRSRQRALVAKAPHGDEPVLVMVVDRDDVERSVLCSLLEGFGFTTHAVAEATQAVRLLGEHQFVAVFADIALDGADGGAGIELARLVRAEPQGMLFVLVSRPLSAVDRVRAQLAGFEAAISKRVTRGDVAGVLDKNGIALPVDPRRT